MNEIHPQLLKDCLPIGKMPLSYLLLMLDANYPWCVLVPARDEIQEIHELPVGDQRQLLHESSELGRAMMQGFKGDKLNVAALGNLVPQLHVHHIVRYRNDPAWPAPVWGRVPARPYDSTLQHRATGLIKQHLDTEIEYFL